MKKAEEAMHAAPEGKPPAPEEKPLAPGDRVTHRAPGAPEMEVLAAEPGGRVACQWWDAQRGLRHDTFPAEQLKRVAARGGDFPQVTK